MSDVQAFHDLIRRVRAGDEEAAATLVREYERDVRRVVRSRLKDSALKQLLDSMDICQSVMANFFVRASLGQFELNSPDDLRKLLVTMACNRFNDQARRKNAARRGAGVARVDSPDAILGCADPAATPSQVVAYRDLYEHARDRLTPEERVLFDRRSQGYDWAEIADECGKSAEALRKQYSRAVGRIAREIGLDEVGDDDRD
jgi:RNA polymerase sigma-70 factor (ECF subfamily)